MKVFRFKNLEKIEKRACLEICFFDFSADCYRKVQLAEKEREMKLTEETPFFFIYSVWTKNGGIQEQVKRLRQIRQLHIAKTRRR